MSKDGPGGGHAGTTGACIIQCRAGGRDRAWSHPRPGRAGGERIDTHHCYHRGAWRDAV